MRIFRAVGLCALCGSIACSPDLADRVPRAKPAGRLVVEPPLVEHVASRSVEFWAAPDTAPRLFALALSDAQVNSVRKGQPSKTLLEHEVPLFEESDVENVRHPGFTRWTASALLSKATSYTVVGADARLKFMTKATEPTLVRIWPPDTTAARGVYCAESDVGLLPLGANPKQLWGDDRVWFLAGDAGALDAVEERGSDAEQWASEQRGTDGQQGTDGHQDAGGETPGVPSRPGSASWALLAGETPCFSWQGVAGARPPLHWNGYALEPSPTTMGARKAVGASRAQASEEVSPASCAPNELVIHSGCVSVRDDGVVVRPTVFNTFWTITGDAQGWFVSEQGEPGAVRGLTPDRDFRLTLVAFDASGASVQSELTATTTSAQAHVVINEVLADPVGAETSGEWIEVYNDGANVVELRGWVLEDDGGKVDLPAVQLAPFGYALLVNDTYRRSSELDVVPDEDVFLIRLPSLGKSGLSNQGETLRLMDNSGMVVSSFPASPKPTTGVSVARREPWFVGAQARAFGLHAAPYASPGKRNSLGF